MTRAWTTVVLWGVFLAVLAAVTAPFDADVYTYTLLAGSALFVLALGVVVLVAGRRGDDRDARGVVVRPDLSFPSMLLGIGIAALALGAELGLWLALIGAGLCALAIGGLVREWRAQRRAAEEL
jgi:hypothetical protein